MEMKPVCLKFSKGVVRVKLVLKFLFLKQTLFTKCVRDEMKLVHIARKTTRQLDNVDLRMQAQAYEPLYSYQRSM